jgi:hypothetical protein
VQYRSIPEFTIKLTWWIATRIDSITAAFLLETFTHQQVVAGNNFGVLGQNVTYNIVVVGGGTRGLAVAYRPVEDETNTVAIIEAGGFYVIKNGNTTTVPAYNQGYNYITPDPQ